MRSLPRPTPSTTTCYDFEEQQARVRLRRRRVARPQAPGAQRWMGRGHLVCNPTGRSLTTTSMFAEHPHPRRRGPTSRPCCVGFGTPGSARQCMQGDVCPPHPPPTLPALRSSSSPRCPLGSNPGVSVSLWRAHRATRWWRPGARGLGRGHPLST